jgi:hypothetical protein
MAPDGLISVDAERRLQLLNDGPVCDEHIAAVEHELGDELQAMKPKVTKGRKLAVPPPTRGLQMKPKPRMKAPRLTSITAVSPAP